MQPDLTISLINHSNPQMLRDCLRSLYAATHEATLDVWVVDNATDGRLVPEMQAEFPHVHWHMNAQRQGFSANHNQVLRQATGRYACILNDDTVVHAGAFDALVRYMDENPHVGMAGARLLNTDGSQQNCTFKSLTLWTELIGICLLPECLCHLKTCYIDWAQTQDRSQPVDWVLGACVIVRAATLAQVGLLDAQLSPIANNEEIDWCLRTWRAGWEVAYCPAATLTHYGGQSMRTDGEGADLMRIEMSRSRLAFFRKHHGRLQEVMLRVIYSATLPWNWVMLTQTMLRKRATPQMRRNSLSTLYGIAVVSLRPRGGIC